MRTYADPMRGTMPELNLTKAAIDALPLPAHGKSVFYHDTRVRGLTVRIYHTGRRVFFLYRWAQGRPQQQRLGDYPSMTIEQARREVEKLNVGIDGGLDPRRAREEARGEKTLSELVTWYEERYGARKKTGARDRRQLELYFPELLPRRLSAITRADVRELHGRRGLARPGSKKTGERATGYAANRALAVLRAIFNQAIRDEVFDGANPAEGVKPFPEHSRERRLRPTEAEAFFKAVDEEPSEDMRDYVLLSLCTGARRGNVLAMRWADIDFAAREWRIPETKNGRPLIVPLEDQELAILRRRRTTTKGPWVLPGRNGSATGHLHNPAKGWQRILDRAGIEDFRLHDLRRTLGSMMADTGASLHVIGKTLGHKSQAATLVYARLSLDPVRAAKRAALGALLPDDRVEVDNRA